VDVTNTGKRDGEEVIQLYVRDPDSPLKRARKELKGFKRVMIKAGQTIAVTMTLDPEELAYYDEQQGTYRIEPGQFDLLVGPSSDETSLLVKGLMVR
jgi:beta-glucosidase